MLRNVFISNPIQFWTVKQKEIKVWRKVYQQYSAALNSCRIHTNIDTVRDPLLVEGLFGCPQNRLICLYDYDIYFYYAYLKDRNAAPCLQNYLKT